MICVWNPPERTAAPGFAEAQRMFADLEASDVVERQFQLVLEYARERYAEAARLLEILDAKAEKLQHLSATLAAGSIALLKGLDLAATGLFVTGLVGWCVVIAMCVRVRWPAPWFGPTNLGQLLPEAHRHDVTFLRGKLAAGIQVSLISLQELSAWKGRLLSVSNLMFLAALAAVLLGLLLSEPGPGG